MNYVIPIISVIVPELFVVAMICVVLLVSVYVKGQGRDSLVYRLSMLTLVATFILTLISFPRAQALTTFSEGFIADHLSVVAKVYIYIVCFFVFLYSKAELTRLKMPVGEYYSLCLFSVLGMMLMVSSRSLLMLYLSLEVLSLPLYALCAMSKVCKNGPEASLKYFVTGAISSGFLLYGFSLIYGVSHSIDYTHIQIAMQQATSAQHAIILIGIGFSIAGFAFKFGMVPFHMWVPDVYQGAPICVTNFISSAPKIAILVLLVRLLYGAFAAFFAEWSQLFMVLAVMSMMLGNLVAIAQTSIKRMFAYSSVAHMGYALLGIISGTHVGMTSSLFYMISYSFMAMGGFGVLMLLNHEGVEFDHLDDFRGLNRHNPWMAFVMMIILFSMAGIPPTVGFIAKLGVVMALVHAHMIGLAIIAMVFAVIGCYYYLRVIKVMYFEAPEGPTARMIHQPSDATVAITINALIVLMLGIVPSVLLHFCHIAFK